MGKIDYILLDRADHPDWKEVAELFTRMYATMDEMGLMLPLAEGGTVKWMKTAQNTSGKFGIALLAKNGLLNVGFAHGMIKFLPDYLGGFAVGSITHVYVDENARMMGIGRKLTESLENWFRMKKVHSIELQVITGNPAAQEFWKALGYEEELLQFRKTNQL